MKADKSEYNITLLGEFSDKKLENEFFNNYMKQVLKYIRPVILVLGILYMLFIIPDYFLIRNHTAFMLILANRIIFLILIIILFIAAKKIKNFTKLANLITLYEIIGIVSFLVILSQYESPNFFIQAFGVMLIILGIFLAPNKFVNMLSASLIISLMYFVLSLYYIKGLKPMEYSAGIIYIFIVLVLSSLVSHRINYYNRRQYAYSRELLFLSTIDPLTGIFNRAKFNMELERWIEYFKSQGYPVSVVIFDFDNFKNINDNFGHLVGDKVIVETVNVVKEAIRTSDVFARWGGEEFVLLLPGTDMEKAVELSQKLRLKICSNSIEGVGNITCSFGLAVCRNDDNSDSLMSLADKLLYKAKNAGKNAVAILDEHGCDTVLGR